MTNIIHTYILYISVTLKITTFATDIILNKVAGLQVEDFPAEE